MSDAKRTRLKNFCLWHLARRELSSAELLKKMHDYAVKKWPSEEGHLSLVPQEVFESVLAEMQEYGYQSDSRAAASVFKSEVVKGRGPRRVSQTLAKRGLKLVDEIDEPNWVLAAAKLRQKKFGALPARFEPKDRAKQTRWLAYRGFDYSVIEKVLKTPLAELLELMAED